MNSPDPREFDPVLTSQVRLAVISALISLREADFMELQQLLNVTKGNLGIHGQKLEEAGYIAISKGYAGRVPRTTYRITPRGRRALVSYVRRLEGIVKEASR
jgi:DNA-binding MarR family transcriptional regulator